jgi:hypothetical protein
MIPVPFLKYIPKIFRADSKSVALANKADAHLALWKKDLTEIVRLIRADECPDYIVDELGFILSAGLKADDSILIKRKKVAFAVSNHKLRSTWPATKILIDSITGYSATIISISLNDSGWVLVGNADTDYGDFALLGCDGINDELGIDLNGYLDDLVEPGNIRINLQDGITTPVITAEVLAKVVNDITSEICPAYFRVFLGYVDGSGSYNTYTIIE